MPKKRQRRKAGSRGGSRPTRSTALVRQPSPMPEAGEEEDWDSQWEDGPVLRYVRDPAPARTGRAVAPPPAAGQRWHLENAVVTLVNRERGQHGLPALKQDGRLRNSARAHSEDMARRGFFEHASPEGTSPVERMRRHGCAKPGAENIAMGQRRAADVVAAWMDSPGHRANILHPNFGRIGVGVHVGVRGHWWTQNFGF